MQWPPPYFLCPWRHPRPGQPFCSDTAFFTRCKHIKLLVVCCGTATLNKQNKKMCTETQQPKVLLVANVCTEGLGRQDCLLHDRSAKKTLYTVPSTLSLLCKNKSLAFCAVIISGNIESKWNTLLSVKYRVNNLRVSPIPIMVVRTIWKLLPSNLLLWFLSQFPNDKLSRTLSFPQILSVRILIRVYR